MVKTHGAERGNAGPCHLVGIRMEGSARREPSARPAPAQGRTHALQ